MNTTTFMLRDVANEQIRFYQKDIHTIVDGQMIITKVGTEFNMEDDIERLLQILPEESSQMLIENNIEVALDNNTLNPTFATVRRNRGDLIMTINLAMLEIHYGAVKGDPMAWEVIMGEILTHELTHIEQFRSGRLDYNFAKAKFTWEGEEYETVTNPRSIAYVEQPWEMEAHLAGLQYAVDKGCIDNMDDAWEALARQFEEAA